MTDAAAALRQDSPFDTDRWWMVRAEGGKLQSLFSGNDIVAAGSKTPRVDLAGVTDATNLRARLMAAPDGAEFVASPRLQEVEDFVLNMREGDVVVTPSERTRDVLIRILSGPCRFHPEDPHGLHLNRRVQSGTGKRRDVAGALRQALFSPQIAVFRIAPGVVTQLQALVRAPRTDRL
jgi:predicted Mrr-cat superfamily restriction endonuclease